MLVNRDFLGTLRSESSLEAVLLWGPRQVGKTTLLNQLNLSSELFFHGEQKTESDFFGVGAKVKKIKGKSICFSK
jgi:GTPase SAR1 family protein